MVVLDAPVIDYVFQPIVDRTMQHPADLAISCAYGGAILSCVGTLICVIMFWLVPGIIMMSIMALLVQISTLVMNLWVLNQTRRWLKPGCINQFRWIGTPIRLLTLIGMAGLTYLMLDIVVRWDITALLILGNVVWTCSYYFSSCDLPPPRPRRIGVAVPASYERR